MDVAVTSARQPALFLLDETTNNKQVVVQVVWIIRIRVAGYHCVVEARC